MRPAPFSTECDGSPAMRPSTPSQLDAASPTPLSGPVVITCKMNTTDGRDCLETGFAAVPPDVRKGYELPARAEGIRGCAPNQGRSPGMIGVLPPVGRSRHRTSGGTAANRSFHTVFTLVLLIVQRSISDFSAAC